jgi:conjugative relaxase-like TrwC/TraI family protein
MFALSSKALSASGAKTYHANEFTKGAKEYYSESDTLVGTWYGTLANEWALKGGVSNEDFTRIANGQHPTTGVQLVNHQTPRTITNAKGETTTTMEHRAGWDGTFSAPKSLSLTALVGGDARVRAAHDASVHAAIDELEHFIQARPGGSAAARPKSTDRSLPDGCPSWAISSSAMSRPRPRKSSATARSISTRPVRAGNKSSTA